MGIFKKLFKEKDKKTVFYLFALCGAGILFIALSLTFGKPDETGNIGIEGSEVGKLFQTGGNSSLNTDTMGEVNINTRSDGEYEGLIEKKLQDILSCVDGAGDVLVMVTFSQSEEIVIAADTTVDESKTTESDSEGGSREVYNNRSSSETLLVRGKDGGETPIVLTELYPKVEGVLIVAEGGGDVHVKDALIRAAQTVLGIMPHRVEVLKMK